MIFFDEKITWQLQHLCSHPFLSSAPSAGSSLPRYRLELEEQKTNEKLEHRGHTGASFRGETIKLRLSLNCHQLLTTLNTTKDITHTSLILLHLVQLVLQLLNVVLNLGSWTDNTSAYMILFVVRTQQKRPIWIYQNIQIFHYIQIHQYLQICQYLQIYQFRKMWKNSKEKK